ncbi:MAG: LysM peptidoglycan-binding domain-containing protein [Chitinophagales bacterium]
MVLLVQLMSASFAQTVKIGSPATKNYDLHLVTKGETLYGVSRKFNTSVDELLTLNPEIVNNNLEEGKMIKVPMNNSSLSSLPENNSPKKNSEKPILHNVEKGETVFSISKKYNTDVPTILKWNNLSKPEIKVGQSLIVGYEKTDVAGAIPVNNENQTVVSADKKEAAAVSNANESTSSEKENEEITRSGAMIHYSEKGIATWTKSEDDNGNFYALHPSAPLGTEITVRNLMNNKTIKVKVIGKLPATSENENVLIKLSKSSVKQLNALDEKFLVEINYSAPELISSAGTN